ncbi:MAG TPA: hypothetical protein VNT01_09220 [Symbiobacteriaceae bacterium]|nr:hypothetical protein [Symbiobacteriaceae bacterium]
MSTLSVTCPPAPLLAGEVNITEFDCNSVSPVYLIEAGQRRWRVGQTVKEVLQSADGLHDPEAIGRAVSASLGRALGAGEVERILAWATAEGLLAGTTAPKRRMLSGRAERIFLRTPLLNGDQLAAVSRWGAHLINWPTALGVMAAAIAARLLIYPGMLTATIAGGRSAVDWGLFLLMGLGLGLAHELGHGSATVRFGRRPGNMGVAFYLIYPVFYSDVSSVWVLPRSQRAVVDAAGAYFQTAFSTACLLAYYWWPSPTLLWTAILSDYSMLMIMNPFLKMDGYWMLSDLTGLPNLRSQSNKALGSLFAPHRWRRPPVPEAGLWILRIYGVLTIGFFGWIGFLLVRSLQSGATERWAALIQAGLPRLLGGDWSALPELLVGLGPAIGLLAGSLLGLVQLGATIFRSKFS